MTWIATCAYDGETASGETMEAATDALAPHFELEHPGEAISVTLFDPDAPTDPPPLPAE